MQGAEHGSLAPHRKTQEIVPLPRLGQCFLAFLDDAVMFDGASMARVDASPHDRIGPVVVRLHLEDDRQ